MPGVTCLPLIVLAAAALMAHREAEKERRQQALNTALYRAAQENAASKVEKLLAEGAEANALESYREPEITLTNFWIHWWRRLRGLPVEESGGSDTAESAFSVALTHAYATKFADWQVLKLLVDHGANPNQRPASAAGQTALDWTTELENWHVTGYLLDHGANPNVTGMSNSNPFVQTVACDNLQVATKMLLKGADVNFVPKEYGDTPLCCTIIHENFLMIRLLLDHGANIDLPNPQGATPLLRCQGSAKERQLVTFLLQRGADPNRPDQKGDTPLMKAAADDDAEMVQLYLKHGANAALRNKQGQTALQAAQAHHASHVIALLQAQPAHRTP